MTFARSSTTGRAVCGGAALAAATALALPAVASAAPGSVGSILPGSSGSAGSAGTDTDGHVQNNGSLPLSSLAAAAGA